MSSLISEKAFDIVWQAALWATMRKYNLSANLVETIEQLNDKATSAVQVNGSIGEWFRTTVRVRQGCLLSPTLFNIFLKRIMSDALEEHDGNVIIGRRSITNLGFADDIDALAEEEQELEALVERTPDPGQEKETKMVWPCFKVVWFSKDNPTGHSERTKKKRQTEEEVGRQYQRVDRNGLCQLN